MEKWKLLHYFGEYIGVIAGNKGTTLCTGSIPLYSLLSTSKSRHLNHGDPNYSSAKFPATPYYQGTLFLAISFDKETPKQKGERVRLGYLVCDLYRCLDNLMLQLDSTSEAMLLIDSRRALSKSWIIFGVLCAKNSGALQTRRGPVQG